MKKFSTDETVKKIWQRNVRIHAKLVEMESETKSLKADIESLKYSVKIIYDIVVNIQQKLENNNNEFENKQ